MASYVSYSLKSPNLKEKLQTTGFLDYMVRHSNNTYESVPAEVTNLQPGESCFQVLNMKAASPELWEKRKEQDPNFPENWRISSYNNNNEINYEVAWTYFDFPADIISKLLPDQIIDLQIQYEYHAAERYFIKSGELCTEDGRPYLNLIEIRTSQLKEIPNKNLYRVSFPVLKKEAGTWADLYVKKEDLAFEYIHDANLNKDTIYHIALLYFTEPNVTLHYKTNGILIEKEAPTESLIKAIKKSKENYHKEMEADIKIVVPNQMVCEKHSRTSDEIFYIIQIPYAPAIAGLANLCLPQYAVTAAPEDPIHLKCLNLGPKRISRTLHFQTMPSNETVDETVAQRLGRNELQVPVTKIKQYIEEEFRKVIEGSENLYGESSLYRFLQQINEHATETINESVKEEPEEER